MKNYPKTSFDKSRGFNKEEIDKIKKICSNQVLEATFSNHVLNIDVDSIMEIHSLLVTGRPLGGPACPPVNI